MPVRHGFESTAYVKTDRILWCVSAHLLLVAHLVRRPHKRSHTPFCGRRPLCGGEGVFITQQITSHPQDQFVGKNQKPNVKTQRITIKHPETPGRELSTTYDMLVTEAPLQF